MNPKKPKTTRQSMPVKDWECMGKQNPQMAGMKCCTRKQRASGPLDKPMMNFYYK